MDDPVELAKSFVIAQRAEQDRAEEERDAWCKRIPELADVAKSVVNVFHEAGHTNIDVEARADQILICFGKRLETFAAGDDLVEPSEKSIEQGAEAYFFFDAERNKVVGFRKPFVVPDRDAKSRNELQEFHEFPHEFTNDEFGVAVLDFLKWASVGEGRRSRKLRF